MLDALFLGLAFCSGHYAQAVKGFDLASIVDGAEFLSMGYTMAGRTRVVRNGEFNLPLLESSRSRTFAGRSTAA